MMQKLSRYITLYIIIIGLIFIVLGAKFPTLFWMGIDWGRFFSNLGLYIAVVVALQWYYDKRTKDELVLSVVNVALSNANVAGSGISNFYENTKDIDYESAIINSEELVIGFLHSSRFIEDNFPKLKERAKSGRKTTILLANPKGNAIEYLLQLTDISGHIKPSIKNVIGIIDQQINCRKDVKKKIVMKYHDTVLRYSFVHTKEGIWVKFYRNSQGMATTPGVYIKRGFALYDYFEEDIQKLNEESKNVKFG